jgi:hypothetical protein
VCLLFLTPIVPRTESQTAVGFNDNSDMPFTFTDEVRALEATQLPTACRGGFPEMSKGVILRSRRRIGLTDRLVA